MALLPYSMCKETPGRSLVAAVYIFNGVLKDVKAVWKRGGSGSVRYGGVELESSRKKGDREAMCVTKEQALDGTVAIVCVCL